MEANLLQGQRYGGIDRFRLLAALLIVAIHTAPLSSLSLELDFAVTRVIGRVAVPFFFMTTGYFLLRGYLGGEKKSRRSLWRFVQKTGIVYAIATAIYLPFSIYAGHYEGVSLPAEIWRNIIFDGTFYHLWYFPAAIIGALLVYLLSRRLSMAPVLIICGALYALGLLGDSYYGLLQNAEGLQAAYEASFHISSYTRNGILYAPIFLAMGGYMAVAKRPVPAAKSLVGCLICLALMLAEGLILYRLGWQRHDSMYILLLPVMFFLFQFLLNGKSQGSKRMASVTMWIYILHPLFIIAVRGFAKLSGTAELLIENSLLHYAAVCLLSVLFSVVIVIITEQVKRKIDDKDKTRARPQNG